MHTRVEVLGGTVRTSLSGGLLRAEIVSGGASPFADVPVTNPAEDQTITPTGIASTAALGTPTVPEPIICTGEDSWTFVVLGSEFSTASTSNQNVTGLAFTPAANKVYQVRGVFLVSRDTAGGARPGVVLPTGMDDHAVMVRATTTDANSLLPGFFQGTLSTTNAALTTGLPSSSTWYYAELDGALVTGATPSGNLQVTLRASTAATVRMGAGSFIAYQEVE